MKKHLIIGAVVAIAIATVALTVKTLPQGVYPQKSLTPGKAETLNIADLTKKYPCPPALAKKQKDCTYSESHREVNDALHKKIYDEYKVPQNERNSNYGEVDHFHPLCAGGSNDPSNLWYEPSQVLVNGEDWGYHKKDRLETWVCIQVKAGKLAPKDVFKGITTDWVAFYKLHRAEIEKNTIGGISNDPVE